MTLHFADGCKFSFAVRELSGNVLYNETLPTGCGVEGIPNEVTLTPRWSHHYPFSWDLKTQSGAQASVPGDYVLSASIPSIEAVPRAETVLHLSSEAYSLADTFAPVSRGLVVFSELIVLAYVYGSSWAVLWRANRSLPRIPLRQLIRKHFGFAVGFGIFVGYMVQFGDQFCCVSIDCSATIMALERNTVLGLVAGATWMAIALLAFGVSRFLKVLSVVYEVAFALSLSLAWSAMIIVRELVDEFIVYDWRLLAADAGLVGLAPVGVWFFLKVFAGSSTARSGKTSQDPVRIVELGGWG